VYLGCQIMGPKFSGYQKYERDRQKQNRAAYELELYQDRRMAILDNLRSRHDGDLANLA